MSNYTDTRFDPWTKFASNPLVNDRREFPAMRREWTGDRVCIRFIRERGDRRHTTRIGFAFGTLVEGQRGDNIGVMTKDGYKGIHYRRVTEVWNLSKTRGTEPTGADLRTAWAAAGATNHPYQRRALGLPGCAVCGVDQRGYMHPRSHA